MANVKISELNELDSVTEEDLFAVVDAESSETKKIKVKNLKLGGTNIPVSDTAPSNPSDGDFWLDTSDETTGSSTEVVNTLDGDETDKAPSVNAVNTALDKNAGSMVKYEGSDTTITGQEKFGDAVTINCKTGKVLIIGDASVKTDGSGTGRLGYFIDDNFHGITLFSSSEYNHVSFSTNIDVSEGTHTFYLGIYNSNATSVYIQGYEGATFTVVEI